MSFVNDLNIKRLEGIAIWMAPALRDKFDFSDEKDYEKLAELSFKAAKAMVKHSDGLLADATAKDIAELAKAKAEELAKAAEQAKAVGEPVVIPSDLGKKVLNTERQAHGLEALP